MAGFVQIIEFRTSRIDEIRELAEKWNTEQSGMAVRGTVAADRDEDNRYFNIVEFESYEKAMENSERSDTSEFAAKMAELCDGPPTFYNLDVVMEWTD
jgi:hypothetical protein